MKTETNGTMSLATHLVRICDQTSNTLGRPRAAEHTEPLRNTTPALSIRREPLQSFVEDPLDGALGDAEITSAKTLVKTTDTLLPEYLLDHRVAPAHDARRWSPRRVRSYARQRRRHGSRARSDIPVFLGQLQPRLDDPDGIRRRTSGDPCNSCRREMDV